MGVWIETKNSYQDNTFYESHPVWVCGLKHPCGSDTRCPKRVTPCMGVWIETHIDGIIARDFSHTLYGCVD